MTYPGPPPGPPSGPHQNPYYPQPNYPQPTGQHGYPPPPHGYPPPPQGYPPPPRRQWLPEPPKKTRKWPWVVGGIFGFFVLVGSCGGNTSSSSTTTKAGSTSSVAQIPTAAAPQAPASKPEQPRAAPTVIKVKEMGNDFEANQLAAEKKWGGKYVQFTAPVGNINSYSVTFTDVTTKFSFTQVSCDFEDESAVLKLAKDKPATVRGVVGDDQLLGVIDLKDCEVVG